MRALVFVYIIEKVAHTHAQNAPLEWFSFTPRLLLNQHVSSSLVIALTLNLNSIPTQTQYQLGIIDKIDVCHN